MPEPFAGAGIKSDKAIGEKIVAPMPHADEVGLGRAGGDVSDAAHFVHGQPAQQFAP